MVNTKKSYIKSFIEKNKRESTNGEYIKENFIGVYPLGVLFKKYQSNMVDNFVGAIKINYETFPLDVKGKVSVSNFGKISFKEEPNSFSVNYVFSPNELMKDEMVVTSIINIVNDEINVNFSTNIESILSSSMELDKLINSYNNVNFEFEDFNRLIDCINQFSVSLVYIISNYINKQFSPSDSSESIYNNEAVINFLNFFEEELKREIFNNAIISKYVEIIINKKKYIISINAKTFTRNGYLIVDYIFSPEKNKFKRVNFASSMKETKIDNFKDLGIETIVGFINALKDDLSILFKKSFIESKYKIPPKGFVFNVDKYKSGAVFTKGSNEYNYLESITELPEGVEYNQEVDNYVIKYNDLGNKKLVNDKNNSLNYIQKKDLKTESIKTIPRNIQYMDDTTAPSNIANAPNKDLGMAKPIINGLTYDDDGILPFKSQTPEDIVTSDPVNTKPEIVDNDSAPVVQVSTPEELKVSYKYPKKELMYLSSSPTDAEQVINIIKSEGIEVAINKITNEYYQTTDDITVTDDYMNDLDVDSDDIIESSGDYLLIYDPINLEVALLKDIKNVESEISKIESYQRKKSKIKGSYRTAYKKENTFNGDLRATSMKDIASLSKPTLATMDTKYTGKSISVEEIFDGSSSNDVSGNTINDGEDVVSEDENIYSIVDNPNKLEGKTIIYLSEDKNEASLLINRIKNGEIVDVVNEIVEKYKENTTNITTTDDYINDLKISKNDIIDKVEGYTIIYNDEDKTFAILKDYDKKDLNDLNDNFDGKKTKEEKRKTFKRKSSIKENYLKKRKYKKESEDMDEDDIVDEDDIIPKINEEELDLTGKEIVYLAEDPEEAKQIIELIQTPQEELGEDEDGEPITGVKAAIDYIMDVYYETPEEDNEIHVTDNYLDDLEVDSKDIIETEGPYTLIYDIEDNEVVLLRSNEEILKDESKEDNDESEEDNDDKFKSKLGGKSTGNLKNKDEKSRKNEISSKDLNNVWNKKYGYSNTIKIPNLMEKKKIYDKIHSYFSEKNIKFERKNMSMTNDIIYNNLKKHQKVKSYINVKIENKKYKVGVFESGVVKIVPMK